MKFGVYRSKDQVDNLKVKLTLRKVTATNVNSNQQNNYDNEARIFSWQEKVFSRAEVIKYNKINDDEERAIGGKEALRNIEYHSKVVAQLERETANNDNNDDATEGTRTLEGCRLFTYVDKDDFFADQGVTPVTVSSKPQRPSFLENQVNEVRRRHGMRQPNRATAIPIGGYTEANVVSDKLTARDKGRRVIDTPFKIMHIVADLSDQDSQHSPLLDDHILCTLKIDSNGVLEATSEYDQGPPYRIHTHRGTIFEFVLEHASVKMAADDHEKESEILTALQSKHMELLNNRLEQDFQQVPNDNSIIYHVFGEVVSASQFEYSNLYIRLLIDLPPGFQRISESEPLPFVTQISRTTSTGNDDAVAKFAYPFELELECTEPRDDDEIGLGAPRILYQVNSLDYFERHRTEGYGHVTMPLKSGSVELNCTSWRPVGTPVTSTMSRFFLGGSTELEDPTYVGIPQHHPKVLSRIGMSTITTGNVKIRLNVIKQTRKGSYKTERIKHRQKQAQNQHMFGVSDATTAALSTFQ